MTIRKHPSTLLQDRVSPLNVHQWQLWLPVLQGWMEVCLGRLHWGLGKHFFPSHVQLEQRHLCYSEFCSPRGLGPLAIMWLHILSCLLSFCFLYLQDRGNCVLKFLCHIPSFQYSAWCTEGHGFPGLLAGAWFLLVLWVSLMLIFGFLCVQRLQLHSGSGCWTYWPLSMPDCTPKRLLECAGESEACELADGSVVVFTKGLRWLKLVNLVLS